MLSSKVNGFSTVGHEAGFTECLRIGLEGENRDRDNGYQTH